MSSDTSGSEQEQQGGVAGPTEDGRVYVVTPQAMAVEGPPAPPPANEAPASAASVTDQVSEPAKVMRIAT